MNEVKRTTYNLRYLDNGEWIRGYRSYKVRNAEAQARHVAETTGRAVEVYGGEGAYRVVISIAKSDGAVSQVPS